MHNECCEHNEKCNWAVGSNFPGYLPENHAEHFSDWYDAYEYFMQLSEDLPVVEPEKDIETIGKDGMIYWLVAIGRG
jgi:hypothetical protein